MKVQVKSVFDCESKRLFDEIKKTKSLIYIAKPLIRFEPYNRNLIDKWQDGNYLFSMYFLEFLPIGKQWIVISIDDENMKIRDNGHSKLIKKWDHIISVEKINDKKSLYTDTIDIKAGFFTIFIFLYAHIFYRYRQSRWKKIIKNNFNY